MKNIFIQLKAKALLKKEPLLKMLNIDPEEEDMPAYLESYFESETEATVKQNASFILTLIEHHQEHATKDKLYALLVFFTSKLSIKEINEITLSVEKSTQSITTKVRFYSLLYKSTTDNQLKKQLLSYSITLIEQENKISIFSNFVENFDNLVSTLTFNQNEFVKIYLKLINYLQKHIVYKKLWRHHIVQCLTSVVPENALSQEVDALIVKLLKASGVSEETVKLVHQDGLKKNKFYPFLETLLLGEFEKFETLDKSVLESAGVKVAELKRRVKVQAIPRTLSNNSTNIQVVSYEQVSQILCIEKEEVEAYIIEAIQEGILRAKIDESSETIIVNSVKFRTLREQQGAALQKNLTNLATRLEKISC